MKVSFEMEIYVEELKELGKLEYELREKKYEMDLHNIIDRINKYGEVRGVKL